MGLVDKRMGLYVGGGLVEERGRCVLLGGDAGNVGRTNEHEGCVRNE